MYTWNFSNVASVMIIVTMCEIIVYFNGFECKIFLDENEFLHLTKIVDVGMNSRGWLILYLSSFFC